VEEKFLARADVQNDGFTPRRRQRANSIDTSVPRKRTVHAATNEGKS
jgi:hypothetical protein